MERVSKEELKDLILLSNNTNCSLNRRCDECPLNHCYDTNKPTLIDQAKNLWIEYGYSQEDLFDILL